MDDFLREFKILAVLSSVFPLCKNLNSVASKINVNNNVSVSTKKEALAQESKG